MKVKKLTYSDMVGMRLNEEILANEDPAITITRVPGGWIYLHLGHVDKKGRGLLCSSTFVPSLSYYDDRQCELGD